MIICHFQAEVYHFCHDRLGQLAFVASVSDRGIGARLIISRSTIDGRTHLGIRGKTLGN